MTTLWDPIRIGRMNLPHRLAMSPLTRSRAMPDGTPSEFAAEYYSQRASLGLLISEGTQPSEDAERLGPADMTTCRAMFAITASRRPLRSATKPICALSSDQRGSPGRLHSEQGSHCALDARSSRRRWRP